MKLRITLCFILTIFSFNCWALDINRNDLLLKAKQELSSWYYFKVNEELSNYSLTTDNIFFGKTSQGKSIVVIAFPSTKKSATARVYFEYVDGELNVIDKGVTGRSVKEIKERLENGPADWLFEIG